MNIKVDSEEQSPSRAWSPHTAALHRRRKFDTETERDKLRGSLSAISLDDDDMDLFANKPKSDSSLKSPNGRKSKSKTSKSPSTARRAMTSPRSSKSPSSLKKKSKSGASKLPGSPPVSPSKLKVDKSPVPKELTQDDIPLAILEKLMVITDPDPEVKKSTERSQLEVDMMRDPTEKRILVEFRHKFDRKKFLSDKSDLERRAALKLSKEISIEEQKEEEFKAECRRKRQAEIEAEIAAREREENVLKEARKHTVETIAKDMEGVRREAETGVKCATSKIARKKRIDEEVQRAIDHFRETDGRNMHDAQRALKEARIEQDIRGNYSNGSLASLE
mmetsp:Transcript_29926/g.72533  ORF Transcript_29926/g.72533 Transcript_29926/m.72533 type:complete len:334 (-) Transcript_29926:283-1284(-)